MVTTRGLPGDDPENAGQSPEEEAKPEKIPVIEINPSADLHAYLKLLAGGTMGKTPTAVATFLLIREVQRLIDAKHHENRWL